MLVIGQADFKKMSSSFWRCACAGLLGIICAGALVNADTITTQTGRRYDGDVVAENATTVSMRIEVPGSNLSFTQQIDKSHIRSWDRGDRQGAPYVRIPIVGEIGTAVTTESVRQALAPAEGDKPQYIVFVIDSNGGRIDTMFEICDLISAASQNYHVVASVKKAYSAAAIITMCCRDIYMMPGAVLGAAVPMRMTVNGPRDIQAKFASAIEAKERTYASAAGHDDLLVRGMMEMELEIYLKEKDGKASLDTSGPGTLLKPKEHILTLTADDAVKCGLARYASDLDDLGKQLTGGPWYECTQQPWATASNVAQTQRREQAARTRGNYASSETRSELSSIQQQLLQLVSKVDVDHQQMGDANTKYASDSDQIMADYHAAIAKAEHDSNGAYEIAMAKETARKALAAARTARDGKIAGPQADVDTTTAEVTKLRKQAADLVAGVSSSE